MVFLSCNLRSTPTGVLDRDLDLALILHFECFRNASKKSDPITCKNRVAMAIDGAVNPHVVFVICFCFADTIIEPGLDRSLGSSRSIMHVPSHRPWIVFAYVNIFHNSTDTEMFLGWSMRSMRLATTDGGCCMYSNCMRRIDASSALYSSSGILFILGSMFIRGSYMNRSAAISKTSASLIFSQNIPCSFMARLKYANDLLLGVTWPSCGKWMPIFAKKFPDTYRLGSASSN